MKVFGTLMILILLVSGCASPSENVLVPIVLDGIPVPDSTSVGYPSPIEGASIGFAYPVPVEQIPGLAVQVPQPKIGNAAIGAVVYSPAAQAALTNVEFYFSWNADPSVVSFSDPDRSRGDIIGQTNSQGQILLDEVAPGSYNLLLRAANGWVVVTDLSMGTPILFTFEADQAYPLGVLQVSWP